MSKRWLAKSVAAESPRWVELDLISEEQRGRLIDFLDKEAAEEFAARQKKDTNVLNGLPGILIGLATVMLCVGIFLFYAANWRHMAASFKLSQVFLLIGALYGGSFYVLKIKQGSELLGRALLFLGMVSFGAGIMLVAQIFHISAHPTNGVLVWALGTLAMSWVMEDRWGAWLTFVLVAIWGGWEAGQYLNPNYPFLAVAALCLAMFWRVKEKLGAVVVFASLLLWFGERQSMMFVDLSSGWDVEIVLMSYTLSAIPFGLFLVQSGRWMEDNEFLNWSGIMLRIVGWVGVLMPFLALSWNLKLKVMQPLQHTLSRPIFLQYLVFFALAVGLYLRRSMKEERWNPWHGMFLALAAVLFLYPVGNQKWLLVGMHIGLVLTGFGLLASSLFQEKGDTIESGISQGFLLLTLLVKYVGFSILGWSQNGGRFVLAYVVGFFVFATIYFLANELFRVLTKEQRGKRFTGNLLGVATALLGFFAMYTVSFKLPLQNSVFTLDTVVFVLLFSFLAIALALYGWLWKVGSERLPLALSFALFAFSVGVLLIARPSLGWIPYTILFNLLLFLIIGAVIWYSTHINSKALVNLAVAGFILVLLTRYFDLLWDALSGSALFIVTGLVVLGGGTLLERNRRRLMEAIDSQTQPEQKADGWRERREARQEQGKHGESEQTDTSTDEDKEGDA
jgi:uncharacterized membrane protein